MAALLEVGSTAFVVRLGPMNSAVVAAMSDMVVGRFDRIAELVAHDIGIAQVHRDGLTSDEAAVYAGRHVLAAEASSPRDTAVETAAAAGNVSHLSDDTDTSGEAMSGRNPGTRRTALQANLVGST